MLDARDKIPEPGLIQAHMKQNRCCGLKCACVRCARVKRFIKKGAHLSRDVHRHQLRFFFLTRTHFTPTTLDITAGLEFWSSGTRNSGFYFGRSFLYVGSVKGKTSIRSSSHTAGTCVCDSQGSAGRENKKQHERAKYRKTRQVSWPLRFLLDLCCSPIRSC